MIAKAIELASLLISWNQGISAIQISMGKWKNPISFVLDLDLSQFWYKFTQRDQLDRFQQ